MEMRAYRAVILGFFLCVEERCVGGRQLKRRTLDGRVARGIHRAYVIPRFIDIAGFFDVDCAPGTHVYRYDSIYGVLEKWIPKFKRAY